MTRNLQFNILTSTMCKNQRICNNKTIDAYPCILCKLNSDKLCWRTRDMDNNYVSIFSAIGWKQEVNIISVIRGKPAK